MVDHTVNRKGLGFWVRVLDYVGADSQIPSIKVRPRLGLFASLGVGRQYGNALYKDYIP